MRPLVSVIIVTYNSEEYIIKCIKSLKNQNYKNIEILLVDNNSKDKTLDKIKKFYSVKIILNKRNEGFASACNKAILKSRGDYILIINPDVFVRKDTLGKLVNHLNKNNDVGIVGCKLINLDGSLQYSCRRFPHLPVHFLKMLFPKLKSVSSYLMLDRDHSIVQEVDWLLGAFLFIRKRVFEQIGLLDQKFFIYFEDTDICHRAKEAGWKIIYYPHAIATHVYRQASHKILSKEFFHHLRSMLIYYGKKTIKKAL